MKRILMLVLIGLVAVSPGHAATHKKASPNKTTSVGLVAPSADPFQAACAAYEAGRFAEAQTTWERLAMEHGLTASLCYNLGNTAFRQGHRGIAIAWYERARRLSPRDEDIRYNLVVMRSALQDETPSGWETADRVLTPDELAWVLAVLIWVLGFGIGWALWAEWEWARWSRLVYWGVPLLVLVAVWLGAREQDLAANWSVTVQPTIEVRSGPGDQFAVGFTIPEGTRALILNRRPGWIELGVPAKSLKGWAPEDSVVKI